MTTPKLDKATAVIIASLAAVDVLLRDPGSHLFSEIGVLQRQPTVEGQLTQRERYLDRLHANLEADPCPKEPVELYLYTSRGRIAYRLNSLKKRKRKTPSERERRHLLGVQLADFLTAGGL